VKSRACHAAAHACAILLAFAQARAAENVPHFPSNSYVNLGSPTVLQIAAGKPMTVEGWVKFETLAAEAMLYSKNAGRGSPFTFMFGLTGSGVKMLAYAGHPSGTWQEVPLRPPLAVGRWYHLAYAFDGTHVTFFLDGACVGRQPFAYIDDATHSIKIGGYADDRDIQGNISEVRVWDHARDATRIRAGMHRRLTGREAGLLGCWPMNEGTGRVVRDATMLNDGTLSGAATWSSATDLTLAAAGSESVHALPATPANTVTGSNTVKVASRNPPAVKASPGSTNRWTGAGGNDLWHNAANWSAGVPAAGQPVAIHTGGVARLTGPTAMMKSFVLGTNQTVTVEGWNSALRAVDLTLHGTVTHAVNDVASDDWVTWVPQHRILLEGSNITVAAKAKVDADWKGYRVGQGPGSVIGATGGAGHAGEGGYGDGVPGGCAYGICARPEQPGSGGGINPLGAEGGGAVRIAATGRLTIHGAVQANGRSGLGAHGPAGSGGSIWMSCQTLAGSSNGLVQVNGGNGDIYGGGGAGGRMAIAYNPARQAALADPRPAIRFAGIPGLQAPNNGEQLRAGMGTLFLPDTLLIDGNFTAKRLQQVQVAVAGWSQWKLKTLTLNDCIIGVQEGVDVVVAGDLVLTNAAALHLQARPVTNLQSEVGARLTVGGNLQLQAGSWIVPNAHPTNGATVRITVGQDLHVAAGCGFDADLRGYTRGFGPGTSIAGSGGGGYGGISGMAFGGQVWGRAYGRPDEPVLAGSGGGSPTAAGRGGGAIRIDVAGQAVIDGTLTAKGGNGAAIHNGAGSGGSIRLVCKTLAGGNSGLFTVDGGLGNYYGGCGGGGRIAIRYDPAAQAALAAPAPPVRFSARAHPATSSGDRFAVNAQDGTLWFPDRLFLAELLDRQRFRNVRLEIPDFETWAPSALTLDGCVLTLPEGFALSVANDLVLTNGAALTLVAAATNSPAQRYGAELNVGRDLMIVTNCWLQPQAHPTNAAIVGIRVGRNATLAAGGGIDAAGRGWHADNLGRLGTGEGENGSTGGGHGGKGGGVGGGGVYGDASLPLLPGSAAGWGGYGGPAGYSVGGNGGGVVHLRAGGEVRVDGQVLADGAHGCYYGGGGGSGGSIWLAARQVAGTGLLSARGGTGNHVAPAGGGGRIAVWHQLSSEEIESRLAAGSTAGLIQAGSAASFKGIVDVGGFGTAKENLSEAGTKVFLAPPVP
jgi:hypothetical protein